MNAISRCYVEPTMVLQTTFGTPTGNRQVTDTLATGSSADPHRRGAEAPGLLIRSVHCDHSLVDLDMRFSPRPQYGLVTPLVSVVPGGALTAPSMASTPWPMITPTGNRSLAPGVRILEGVDDVTVGGRDSGHRRAAAR